MARRASAFFPEEMRKMASVRGEISHVLEEVYSEDGAGAGSIARLAKG